MNNIRKRKKSRSGRTVALGYLLIVCLGIVIILFNIYSINKVTNESNFTIDEALPSKTISMQILTSLTNEETGIRAYIISKDITFLEPYYLGIKQIQEYSNSLNTLKNTPLGNETINQLNVQTKSIQNFFEEQIVLIDTGRLDEAESNLNQGKSLVDKFRVTDNTLVDKIDQEVNNSRNKVENAQVIQKYLLTFFAIVLALTTLVLIKYILDYANEALEKKNERNKELQQLLSSQEKHLAIISHELKTPLNVIFATAQLFDMYCNSGSLDEKKSSFIKYIHSIKQNSYRLSKLINNIVDLSKIEAGFFKLNLSNNNIVEVVEEIVMSVTDFTESKGLNIIFDTDIEEKFIACDPETIERIVLNLISNAIKFSEYGGEIFVQVKDKNEFVEISVKDTGIGIEDIYLDTIFDKFRQVDKSLTRNAEGTGMGLSLVKSIVALAGGSIKVESVLGKGSKFTVKLPARKVVKEDMISSSKISNVNESILVELSDVS